VSISIDLISKIAIPISRERICSNGVYTTMLLWKKPRENPWGISQILFLKYPVYGWRDVVILNELYPYLQAGY